jgi:hypothetical protein
MYPPFRRKRRRGREREREKERGKKKTQRKKMLIFSLFTKKSSKPTLFCRYGWHFPELAKVVPDNYQYARVALVIKDKAATTAIVSNSSSSKDDDDDDESPKKKGKAAAAGATAAEIKEQLADALGGGEDAAGRAEEVLSAARSSMGQVSSFFEAEEFFLDLSSSYNSDGNLRTEKEKLTTHLPPPVF